MLLPNILWVWLIDSVTNYSTFKILKNKFIRNPSDKDRLFYPIRLQNRIKEKFTQFFFFFSLFVCTAKGFLELVKQKLIRRLSARIKKKTGRIGGLHWCGKYNFH